MQVFFKKEFKQMFNRMDPNQRTQAAPFVRQVWDDLNSISGPNNFQDLSYQIAMESTKKLVAHLKSQKIKFDPDDVVFSLVGSGFVILFAINIKHLSTLEIWSIKPLTS